MTLQLTRMVVMMAKLNMGWVNTVSAIRRIGWKGESSHIAFVAENLENIVDTDKYLCLYHLIIVPPLLMTMKVLLSA